MLRRAPAEPPPPAHPPRTPAPDPSVGLGADVVALPGELALLLRVPLPLRSRRQREAAVGYAVEDLIAEPLEASHVALGPELAPGEFLAIVVRRRDLAEWSALVRDGQRLVPDVLALPVPAEGACSVLEADGRILVRRADGAGYVARAETFGAFWRADGAPQIVHYGGRLPVDLPVSASGLLLGAPASDLARIDVLRGASGRARADGARLAAGLCAIVALALAAHCAVFAAETAALRRIADSREAAVRAEIRQRLPDLPAATPIEIALPRALPQAVERGGFLPLMARASDALAPMADDIAVRRLSWGASDAGLALQIEAADLAALQRIEAALSDAGLVVTAGAATRLEGAAEAQYVVTGGGA